jgi:protein kinase C substrate 80K-H
MFHYCRIEVSELQTQQTFDQNKDGAVSGDEANFFFDSHAELSWEDFLASGWPRMKPFLMLDKGLFKPPTSEPHQDSAAYSLPETGATTPVMYLSGFRMFLSCSRTHHHFIIQSFRG